MVSLIQIGLCIIFGIGSGVIISGGIIAFISLVGLIPIISMRTHTQKHSMAFGNAVILGAIAGSMLSMWPIVIPVPNIVIIIIGLSFGIFTGALIVSLAEILDFIPILDRRIKLKKGISLLVYAIAAGKMVGALYYWLYPEIIKMILSD